MMRPFRLARHKAETNPGIIAGMAVFIGTVLYDFVRFFEQKAAWTKENRAFCAIFHIKRPIAVRSAAILCDFSYKTPDCCAISGHFVRFFI